MITTLLRSTKLLVATLLLMFVAMSVPSPVYAANAAKDAACKGIGEALGEAKDCSATGATEIDSTIATVVNILSLIVGVASVIMVILGGFKYIVSNGDSNGISSAKNTIIYALVGLVIVAVAQILVRLTVAKVAPTTT